jgi:hypothetical protein
MQRNSFVGFGLATLTSLASIAINVNPVFSQTKTSQAENGKVTFKCVKIFDQASDKQIPTTVAWIPERKQHIRFIAWKSEYFPNWSPEKRCQAATKKFQEFYDKGTSNYLSHGTYKGYPVICFVQLGEKCNGENQIFRIKPGSKPEIVLQRILNIAEGKSSEMLYQNSGNQLFIDVNMLFNQADAIDIDS